MRFRRQFAVGGSRTTDNAVQHIECPHCKAAAGVPCITPKHALPGRVHRARVLAYFRGLPQSPLPEVAR